MAVPWIDQFAPMQFTLQPQLGDIQVNPQTSSGAAANVDQYLHYKVAGTIILALIMVYVLQATGFRFVVAASSTAGVGR